MEMLTQNLEPSPEKLTKQLSESLLFKTRIDITGKLPKQILQISAEKHELLFRNTVWKKTIKLFCYAKSCPI